MLIRKMLRDLAHHKMQFISILLMSFLGLFFYAGLSGEWYGVSKTLSSYHAETNLADVWAYGDNFTQQDTQHLTGRFGITEAQRRLRVNAVESGDDSPTLYLYFIEDNRINMPLVVEGSEIDLNDAESIWIDAKFAEARGLSIGDPYSFRIGSIEIEKVIAGLVYSSEFTAYKKPTSLWTDHTEIGFAFCSTKAFPIRALLLEKIEPQQADRFALPGQSSDEELMEQIVFKELLLKTERSDLQRLEEDINSVIEHPVKLSIGKESISGVSRIQDQMDSHKSISGVFPVAFLAVAILTIITTMSRMVTAQRVVIGTLKALGFRRKAITLHYLGYSATIAAAGAVTGVLAGANTLPCLLYGSQQKLFTLPVWQAAIAPSSWVVAVLCVIACIAASYFSIRGILRECPADVLSAKTPGKHTLTKSYQGRFWSRLSFGMQLNIRDVFRSRLRSVMAIIGTASSMALLLSGLSLHDTLADTLSWMYDDIQTYRTQIVLVDGADTEAVDRLADEVDGQLISMGFGQIRTAKGIETITITVIENTELYRITDENRNTLTLRDGQIAISRKPAERLGIALGGAFEIQFAAGEGWTSASAGRVFATPMFQGIVLTRATLQDLGIVFIPTSVITNQAPVLVDSSVAAHVYASDDLIESWYRSMQTLNLLAAIMIAGAGMLSFVVLYNLSLLSYSEKEREFATLKVLGFRSASIRRLMLMQNLWFAGIGVPLGVPLGNWLNT